MIHLADGLISGNDTLFAYSGTYQLDADRFTATVTTRRLAEGPTSVFGIDEVEAELAGTFKGKMAVCTGTAKQVPGLHFEATLFAKPESSEPDAKRKRSYRGADQLLKFPPVYQHFRSRLR